MHLRGASAAVLLGLFLPQIWAAPVKLEVDRQKSHIVAVTRKGGVLSFAGGHEHGILATEWTADVCFDADNIPASSARIVIAAPSLRIDTVEARQAAGLPSKGPGPADVKEIQEKMLGAENLNAGQHPRIEFQSATVEPKGQGVIVLSGPLKIRGQTRSVSAPVTLERPAPDLFVFSGEFRVKQTDYGIRPASVAGVVRVKDLVEIRFQFYAKPTAGSCK